MDIRETDKTYVAGTYNRFPVVIVSGKGSLLTDETGRQYIDMGAGIAVNTFGVCDDAWISAVTEQLGKFLPHRLFLRVETAVFVEREKRRIGVGDGVVELQNSRLH